MIRRLALKLCIHRGVPRGVVWGVQTLLKFQSFDKTDPNSQFCEKYIRNNLISIRVSLMSLDVEQNLYSGVLLHVK
jgi:hypothetical protein